MINSNRVVVIAMVSLFNKCVTVYFLKGRAQVNLNRLFTNMRACYMRKLRV